MVNEGKLFCGPKNIPNERESANIPNEITEQNGMQQQLFGIISRAHDSPTFLAEIESNKKQNGRTVSFRIYFRCSAFMITSQIHSFHLLFFFHCLLSCLAFAVFHLTALHFHIYNIDITNR